MESIRTIYKIGRGPSSSHTMGPFFACIYIKNKYPNVNKIKVILFNSLALTGEGHLTFEVIKKTLSSIDVIFETKIDLDKHPNEMKFYIYENEKCIDELIIRSVGGGDIIINDEKINKVNIYPHKKFSEIKNYCLDRKIDLYQYIKEIEGPSIENFLNEVWEQMKATIISGLSKGGILPGKLHVQRKAKALLSKSMKNESDAITEHRLVSAYAFATSEENASGEMIVTAPT